MALSKRAFLISGAGVVVATGAGALVVERQVNPRTPLDYPFPQGASVAGPAVSCSGEPTQAQMEGPFYKPRTPLRADLAPTGVPGRPLVFEGRVLGRDCRPAANAVIDLWNADGEGRYDNAGFLLRGHQFTDAQGRFRFRTVRPASYAQFGLKRAPHLHAKVQARGGELLTTQLYFPGDPEQSRDPIFDPALLMRVEKDEDLVARFDFILA